MLCKGPSAVALNSSYGNRDCSRFKHDLCAAVRAVAEATRGGVLVFFPSHASMKGITDEWRKYGGYRELEAVKAVFTEPRTAHEFQQVCDEAAVVFTAVPCVPHASICVSCSSAHTSRMLLNGEGNAWDVVAVTNCISTVLHRL